MDDYELEAVKAGRRNSASDAERLQMIHDMAVENGAVCHSTPETVEEPLLMAQAKDVEALVATGGAVKALGDGKVGGYLVRFTSPDDPDLTGDFFTAETDFGTNATPPLYYHHGQDTQIKGRRIGSGTLTRDDVGLWYEAQLALRDDYEQKIYQLAAKGKLGLSSGALAHLVTREPHGAAQHVKTWIIGEASLTPTPAEPRNLVIPLKSISEQLPPVPPLDELEGGTAPAGDSDGGISIKSTTLEVTMDITEEKLQEMLAQAAETALKALPAEPKPAGAVTVVHDEADNPFRSLAEQAAAVKTFEISRGRNADPRLARLSVKATGASENVPSEAGFLLEPTLVAEVLRPMHETGPFTSAVRRLPVGTNSNYGWINGVDETSRATGSRWGGIRGYRLGEGATLTASKPKFRRINWELKKYGVMVYATDELLQDVAQFSEIVRTGASEELSFMANDDIINGVGATGPLGLLNTTAYVEVAKETNQAAATISSTNLSKMWARLSPRSKSRAVWYINTDCNPQLDELAQAAGTGALEPRFVAYGPDGILRIKGRPVVETEFNATLGTVGDILLADMSEYLFWEKGGVQVASSIHVQFITDEEVWRFLYRCDGQPSISSPLTPYKGSATQSPFVVLATR